MLKKPDYVLNAIKTFGKPLKDGVIAHKIALELESLSSDERQRLSRIAKRKLEKQTGGLGTLSHEEGHEIVYLISGRKPEISGIIEAESRGVGYRLKASYLGMEAIARHRTYVLNSLLREALKRRIVEKGYKEAFSQNKFFGGTPKFFIVGDFQEPVYVYDGLRVETRVFSDGSALVYLEPKTTWRITLLEYCRILLARGVDPRGVVDYIQNGRPRRNVVTGPFGGSALLIDISFDKRPEQVKFNDETIKQRWYKKYGIQLPEDDFIVRVDMDKNPLTYPASQVFLSTRGLPFSHEQRKVFILTPKKKMEKTKELFRTLLSTPLDIGNTKISFDIERLANLDDLRSEGKILGYGEFQRPLLRFLGTSVGDSPGDIRNSGPYSGPKVVNVVYAYPVAFENAINAFHISLESAYSGLKLGKLRKVATVPIVGKLTSIIYRQSASTVVNEMENAGEPTVAVVVLPYRGDQKFDFIKGSSLKKTKVKKRFQFVLTRTVSKVLERADRGILSNLALHLYFKSLDPDEGGAPWILMKPAGGVGSTAYAAYDVSRDIKREYDSQTGQVIKERREAAARAAICDCYGFTIRMRSKISPVGEALTRDTIRDLILDMIATGRDSLKKFDEPLQRLLLFKDGEIRFNEKALIEKGVNEVTEVEKSLVFEALSVVKSSIERVYTTEGGNPKPGFYVIVDEKTGLLYSSDVSHLTDKFTGEERMPAAPLLIRHEARSPWKNIDLNTIMHEFFDLTILHWSSLHFKTKTCLPLKLVQEIGDYSRREIIIPEDLSYLPL